MKNRLFEKISSSSIFCFVFMLGITLQVYAQKDKNQNWSCQTTESSEQKATRLSILTVVNTSPKIVNVFVHVVRRTNGTGGLTTTQVNDWMNLFCNDYLVNNILIREIGRSYINNDEFYNGINSTTEYNNLIATDAHSNAIDIHLLSPDDTYARASGIPGIALAVGGSRVGTSVLSHEFGHCLGLFHTHSGRGCDDFANCEENINGGNCSTCGDLICDTPADPCLTNKVSASCEYTGDPAFSPDVHNIMSYAPPNCLTHFTNGQKEKMHNTIIYDQIFNSRSYFPNISGQYSIYCSNSYTINYLPSDVTIQWDDGPYISRVSTQGSNPCYFQSNSVGLSWIQPTISYGGFSLPMSQYVVNSAGKIAPSPIEIQMNVPPNRFTASTLGSPGANSYNWYKDGVLQSTHLDAAIFTRRSPYCGNSYLVQVEAVYSCGASTKTNKTVIEPSCGKSLKIVPNPASDIIDVSIVNDNTYEIEYFPELNISIVDSYGSVVYSNVYQMAGIINIQLNNIKNGNYIVTVYTGTEKLNGQLLVNHK